MSLIGRALRVSKRRKLMLAEAFACTFAAWAMIRLMPYGAWRRCFGQPAPPPWPEQGSPPGHQTILADIGWVHAILARSFGATFTCLMLAFSARSMLQRRNLPSVLVLGVKRSSSPIVHALDAHAWVMSDAVDVVGWEARAGHVAVAAYLGSQTTSATAAFAARSARR